MCHNHIFNLHENGSEARFPIFILLYRKEGYAGYGKWGGEDVFRMRITPPDICSWVSQITYIHITDKKPAQLWREYVLGGVAGSDWTANTLLENLIISRTQSNSRMCAYAPTNDGAQLILACTAWIMPSLELSFSVFPFLAHSHIFASSGHMTIFFTYVDTPTSPPSY